MEPRSGCSINGALLLLLLCCFCSSVARSQTDSCSSRSLAAAVSRLIPFDTSNLTCFDAWSSQGFIMRYGKSGKNTWSFVLSAPDTGAYVSVGFSANGAMVGSSAVAGWTNGNGGVGVAKQYQLGGTKPSSCPPDQGSLALVSGSTLVVAQSSRLYLAFQFTASKPQPYLIYAVGPSNAQLSGNYLVRHRSYSSGAVNYATGVASSAGGASDTRKWHGALAGLGWGVLMPIGIALARYFKHRDPFWFYAHISVQGLGFVLGVAGVSMGFKLNDDIPGADSHQALGIAILVFGCLQVLAFLVRPNKGSKVRRYWNWYHHNVGRAAVTCATVNVFVGLSIAHEDTAKSVFYGIFLAVLVIVSVFLEAKLWRRSS